MVRIWQLKTVNWADIKAKRYGGDIHCNTYVETFFGLDAVWQKLGFKLKKQRFGYSGLKNDIEYVLVRMQ